MRTPACLALAAALLVSGCRDTAPLAGVQARESTTQPAADLLARGEYMVRIGGCNDCHTDGYAQQQGQVPKAAWLTGSPLGYTGPWGTTYAANLRTRLGGMDEAQWLAYSANLRTRPIMPDYELRAMSEADRRAIYHFVRSLGPGGNDAPAYLPPGSRPPPPYMELVLPPTAGAAGAR